MNAVKRAPATAMSDIVNYTKKKRKYLKEQDVLHDQNAAQPATAMPTAGSIAYYNQLITTHLNKNGIVPTEKGTKLGTKTVNIPYEDMMADLTHNYIKTKPNLTAAQHVQILKALKKTGMPTRYIRNKKLHERYKDLNGTTPPPPPPPLPQVPQIPPAKEEEPFQPGYTPIKRVKGKKRNYKVDGVLESFGSPI